MFASIRLAKISYVCKPCKIIPFLFVGAMALRMAGDKEGNGEGGKGDGDSNKGVRRGTALVTKWAMATATRVAGEEESERSKGFGGDDKVAGDLEGNGKGGKSDGNGDQDGRQATGKM
jgi:hypothetical protein